MTQQLAEFTIGNIRISPIENTLCFHNRHLKVAPKVMETFCFLHANGDTVVTREKVLEEIWPGRFGSDESLSKAISELRKSLSQLLNSKTKFITTVPKSGYKLELALLTEHSNKEGGSDIVQEHVSSKLPCDKQNNKTSTTTAWSLGVLGVLAFVGISFFIYTQPSEKAHRGTVLVMPFSVFDTNDLESQALGSVLLDATIDSLSNTDRINVASRTSSDMIGAKNMTVTRAKELINIDYLIEGGITRRGFEFEVRYRLVDANNFLTLFSGTVVIHEMAFNNAVNVILRSLSEYFSIPVAYSRPSSLTSEVNRLLLLGSNLIKRSYDEELWRQATDYLERAYQLAPNEPQIIRTLASHYFQMIEFADEDQRKILIKQVNELMARAEYLNLPPDTFWFLKLQLSDKYLDRTPEQSEAILTLLQAAHANGERDYTLYFYLMTTLSSLHRYDEAISYGLEGINEHPLVYRLYAGLSYVYSLKRDGQSAKDWAVKMTDIAPSDESTEWINNIAAMVNGEHQQAILWRKSLRDNGNLGYTLETDALSLSATAQAHQLERLWSLCTSKQLPLQQCWNISMAEAIQSANATRIVKLLTNHPDYVLANELSLGLVIQSLAFLTAEDFTESVISSIQPALTIYLDGRSTQTIPELATLVATYLTEIDILTIPFPEREQWLKNIFQDKQPSEFFLAEQAALSQNKDIMYALLEQIVKEQKTPPIGRYYLFFDSPYFLPYQNEARFLALKEEYHRKLRIKYQNLNWQF
ncbi:winged helix-turn-helix domain-containing protein [Psychrosphaera aestuarii]|uniref:winged helix-turn-helix domain-containing protein n=1 Tax=Psychrosphaera aestuarii TaxID=1266052 RepID=UPI001B31D046|nr:winged helix-turn-helix domain-containing protein [Psychrosphaera aestuarii]